MGKRVSRFVRFIGAWLVLGAPALADMPGDVDLDGDVDGGDFGSLSACLSAPEISVDATCAEFLDLDFDADVDLLDVAIFQRCFSGAGQPGNPDSVSHQARLDNGCLHIIGTAADTVLVLRLRSGVSTTLDVDVANDGGVDFSFDRGQFNCIVVDARGGADVVWIDEQNGVFTDLELTTINGGRGNDTLLGGSGAETFRGGPGNDTASLGSGDDRFIWNPGDDSDTIEGGAGADTIEVHGGDGAEDFTITANGARVRFDRINPAPFFLDSGTCESLVLNANGGNDTLACTGNLASLIQITADGGAGADTLRGSNGADVLMGGDDADLVDGNQGNDLVLLGAGDDTFQWDPGDGSDTVEGQTGHDTVLFNGSAAAEAYDFSANGARLRFTRNVGGVVLDADGIEQFDLRALGGADAVVVNSLAGTTVTQVNVDLAGTLGGTTGDGAADGVIVNGTANPDAIQVAVNLSVVAVSGLAAVVQIAHPEPANDTLTINGLGGVDTITPGPGVTSWIMLTMNP